MREYTMFDRLKKLLLSFFKSTQTQQGKIAAVSPVLTTDFEAPKGVEVEGEAGREHSHKFDLNVTARQRNEDWKAEVPTRNESLQSGIKQPTQNIPRKTDIRQAIYNLDALPAMPVIAQKLLALKMDTEEGERMLLELIEQDPQISARILGLANSAMLGVTRQVKTVKDAAILLGLRRVQSVSASIAILSLMNKTPAEVLDMQNLWTHSFGIAFASQGIARFMPPQMRPPDDQIFLAGMLHDIGFLALAFLDPTLSNKLHNHLAAEPSRSSLEVEREVTSVCHDELGAELARHWKLPEEAVAVVRYHHNPNEAEAVKGQPLLRMINIAEKMLPSFGLIEYANPDIEPWEWEELGIDPTKENEVQEHVNKQAKLALQFAKNLI